MGGGSQVNKIEQVPGEGIPSGHIGPPNRQADTTENITFPHTTYAGGKKNPRLKRF